MQSIEQDIETIRQKITNIFQADCYFQTKIEADNANRELLDAFQNSFPGDITVEHDHVQDTITINCYAYALGLGESDKYRNELEYRLYYPVRGARAIKGAESGFISFLLQENHLQEIEPSEGCLVIYFNQETPKHAGLLIENTESDYDKRVRGRSGNFRAIITHRLLWVDSTYGATIKYYQRLSTEESERYFREYLKSRGVDF